MTRRKAGFVMIALLAVFMGFFREFVFLNINAQIDFVSGGHAYNYTHTLMMWLDSGGYDVGEMVAIKWFATFIFGGAFMILALLGVHVVWRKRKYLKYVLWVYVALFVFSGLSYAVGTEIFNSYYGYRFARIFMGFAQSPIPLMIMIPAFYLLERSGKGTD